MCTCARLQAACLLTDSCQCQSSLLYRTHAFRNSFLAFLYRPSSCRATMVISSPRWMRTRSVRQTCQHWDGNFLAHWQRCTPCESHTVTSSLRTFWCASQQVPAAPLPRLCHKDGLAGMQHNGLTDVLDVQTQGAGWKDAAQQAGQGAANSANCRKRIAVKES